MMLDTLKMFIKNIIAHLQLINKCFWAEILLKKQNRTMELP